MVFIRPKILRDGIAAAIETNAKYNYIRNQQLQDAVGPKTDVLPLLPFTPEPRLPPLPPPLPAGEHARAADGADAAPQAGAAATTGHRRPAPAASDAAEPMNDAATAEHRRRRRRVGFAFAKRHGVLVRRVHDGVAECVYRPGARAARGRRSASLSRHAARARERRRRALRFAAAPGLRSRQRRHARPPTGVEESTDLAHLAQDLPEQADLLESEDDAPIIRLINALLTQAVKENASDIHIEPFENRLVVRFRVDGVLREVLQSQARRRAAGRLAHQGHVQARHRREAPAAGRTHQPAHRRARGRRARLDDPVGPRRARGAAPARQAGRPARSRRSAWIRRPSS